MHRTIVLVLATVAWMTTAFITSACVPEGWMHPAFLGDGDDLGKSSQGSGVGNETWEFDW